MNTLSRASEEKLKGRRLVQVWVPIEDYDELYAVASHKGKSVSTVVRWSLHKWLMMSEVFPFWSESLRGWD